MQYNNTSLSFPPSTSEKLRPKPQGFSWKVRVIEGPGGAQLSVGTAGCTQLPQTETQQRKLWEQKPQVSQLAGNVDQSSTPPETWRELSRESKPHPGASSAHVILSPNSRPYPG